MTTAERAATKTGRAVIYLRRSKENKDGRSVSIDQQRAAAERYAAELGFEVVATLTHDGVSGGKRGRFVELDSAVKTSGASKVICANLDRTARDCAGLLDWLDAAARRGVELWEVGRGLRETRSAAGYLGVGVEGLVAAHYRRVIGEKTAGALAHLRATGRKDTRIARYGEIYTDDGRVERHEGEAAVIVQAQELRAAGLSLRKVSAELVARGIFARSGRPFTATTLSGVLAR